MRKKLKYILIPLLLIVLYIGMGKVLDKMYLSKYNTEKYFGATRYDTVNLVIDKRFKKADRAIIVNTELIDEIVSVAPYAYAADIPVFYTKKSEMVSDIYKEMEKLGIKNVTLVGGITSLGNQVERSLKRYDYNVDRIIQPQGIDMSLYFAEALCKIKPVDTIMVVSPNEFDLPDSVSFASYAQQENIPIIVTSDREDDILKLKNFIQKHNIKKSYIIGNDSYLNTNVQELLPNLTLIKGKDRFDISMKINRLFYKNSPNDIIYVSLGGQLAHKRHILPGQLINAMAISTLAADKKVPMMYIKEKHFNKDEREFIDQHKYKTIGQVGFELEREKIFNVERFKVPTTIAIAVLSLLIVYRVAFSGKKTGK